MQVLVRDNNVDQALKVLKKKMQREGVFREIMSAAPPVVTSFLNDLRDPDVNVRRAIVAALEKSETIPDRAIPVLIEVGKTDRDALRNRRPGLHSQLHLAR